MGAIFGHHNILFGIVANPCAWNQTTTPGVTIFEKGGW